MNPIEIKIGDKYGRLTVIKEVEKRLFNGKPHIRQFLCKCDCGAETVARISKLLRGKNPTCGCQYGYHLTKHGESRSRLYKIWQGMRNRCQYAKHAEYVNYGLRGIKVCDEWQTYEPFRDWAKENGYQEDLTIDRIDVNGNYEPNNCRWITNNEQQLNRRDSIYITYKGETKHLFEWSEEYGIKPHVLMMRYKKYGVSDEIFSKEPFTKTNRNKSQIIKLYNEGLNYKEIAKIVNIKEERISKAIERWGLPHKGKERDEKGRFV